MDDWAFVNLLGKQTGMVLPDAYNTAWVAMVPTAANGHLTSNGREPAWPQALEYLRRNQLPDGGWGDKRLYYPQERTISTLAALRAFLEWNNPLDAGLIERGVRALHCYGEDMSSEFHEPVGYELLLPRLANELVCCFDIDLPLDAWTGIEQLAWNKMALTGRLTPDYDHPRSWWFNMEMLAEDELASFDDRLLNQHGSIVISPSATAAYLRALRLNGRNSPRAAAFLERVVELSQGGAGVCYPIEAFEVMWTLDAYMRAGLKPDLPALTPLIKWLADYWSNTPTGLSYSQAFPVADGDDTAVGYKVLRWAGHKLDDKPLLRFWDSSQQCFSTYHDERSISISAAVHALNAFRHQPAPPAHDEIAAAITNELRGHIERDGKLVDKWHFSPLYPTARVIPALAGWDDDLARKCIDFILGQQHEDGGWGSGGRSNLEETSHATLGLVTARRAGLLPDDDALQRAAPYFSRHALAQPLERLWIGKALYQPVGVVRSLVNAARLALGLQDICL